MSEKALLQAENYTVTEQIERTSDDANTGTNEQQKEASGVKIEGLAIPFNKRSRNGVVYETESLKETAETLVGCSILFNHDDDQPLGHVKDVEVTDEGIRYIGDLNPERRETESLKRGDIPNVSIQAMIEESKSDTADVAVTEFLELSAVTVPGYPSTTVNAEGVAVESFVGEEDNTVSEDVQTEQPDDITYEFEPIPKLVLYDNEADARQRAQDLGVEGIHQHEVNDETYWMAGQTHGQWRQLVGLQESVESTSSESFDDYPEAAQENARQALEAKENSEFDNDDCGTQVGWERANQLDNGENLSEETVQRMHSFFERHDGNQEVDGDGPKEEDCGWLTWQAWGGQEAFDWATEKLEEIEQESKSKEPFADYDSFEDCVQDNQDKADPEAYCAAIKKKAEILGENMTEQEQKDDEDDYEEFTETQFYELVAEVHENLEKSDVKELFEDFVFEGGVMEVLETLSEADEEDDMPDEDDMEDEAGDMDDEDEEEEGSESSNKKGESQDGNNDMSSKTKKELENRIEQLEETIMEMEETEPSKQEAANTPSKKDSSGFSASKELKNKFSR